MAFRSTNWYVKWLQPVAELYKGVTKGRRLAYDDGHKERKKLPRPVISVGNITVGGTGKTPVVLYLCEHLSGWCRIAILSRGYGRKNEGEYLRLPVNQTLDWQAAKFFGDEPVMMAKHVKNTCIHVGQSRYKSGFKALDRDPIDIFILDDGFQHVELYRDLEIVVLDGTIDPRDLEVLPAGPLRESVDSLKRADLVFINHCQPDGSHMIDLNWLDRISDGATIVPFRVVPDHLYNIKTGEKKEFKTLLHRPLFAFCGIGKPEGFLSTLREANLDFRGHRFFADHHYYSGRELHDIEEEALQAGADGLITTEKDSVKIRKSRIKGLPIYAIAVKVEIFGQAEPIWEKIGGVMNVR